MKTTHVILACLTGLATFGASASAAAPPSSNAPQGPVSPVLTACQLEHPVKLTVVAAECGQVSVPENPSDPASRTIHLAVARVPAISRRKQPDPLFVLAGGPGMGATTFYASSTVAFERIRRDRDIVLVDQRGTGRSNALNCELNDEAFYRTTDNEIAAEVKRCLKTVSAHADPRWYTTSIAVQDLDRVRAALGYEHINLYGVSYGTRVAQHYVRRFPQHARSAILDGVVPPTLALGPDTALDAETALHSILARCAKEPDCQKRFGDPTTTYHDLRAQLQASPVSVNLSDPATGEPSRFEFTSYHFATVLRLATYTPEQAALLPLMLHQARASHDFTSLAAQFLLVNRSIGEVVSYGMHNSVVCSEDVPFYDLKSIDRTRLEQTFLGTIQLDSLRSMCAIWPRGPVDPDFHALVRTDVPILLLSGSDDPVTPPAYAAQVKPGFTHSLHVILQGFGHGQLAAPCVNRVMAQFVGRPSVSDLDVSCTREARPTPFFTSLNGPSP